MDKVVFKQASPHVPKAPQVPETGHTQLSPAYLLGHSVLPLNWNRIHRIRSPLEQPAPTAFMHSLQTPKYLSGTPLVSSPPTFHPLYALLFAVFPGLRI